MLFYVGLCMYHCMYNARWQHLQAFATATTLGGVAQPYAHVTTHGKTRRKSLILKPGKSSEKA